MATVYQYFGPPQTNGYHPNSHEAPPQHFEYPQPHPMLPGINNGSYNPHQKRISYMSRDQARQHQSFSVQAEPMPYFMPPHQIPSAHLIDAETYQQNAEKKKQQTQQIQPIQPNQKRKSNINQALPRPSYDQPKPRESTPNITKTNAGHQHKISNQEPITQFQEINNLKQRDKTRHHQIGSALPSNVNIYSKETHSVASTRNPSFRVQSFTAVPNVEDLEDIEDIEDIDIDDILDDEDTPPEPILQHNNTRITHQTNLTRMTELTDLTDMSIEDDDDDDDDDEHDNQTAINLEAPPMHAASLSTELKSFQDGLRLGANLAASKLKSTRTMPVSSLALMNSGMVDKNGNLSKQSMLIINRVREASIGGKLNRIISAEEEDDVPHHRVMASDVSAMSSISSQPKFKYNHNHRPYQSRRNRRQDRTSVVSAYSVASTEVLTPTPGSTKTPNKHKIFDFREDNAIPHSIHVKQVSNEAHPTMNRIQSPVDIGLKTIESSAPSKSVRVTSTHDIQPPVEILESGTPIAYSSVNQNTGERKCLYRFVLSDRDKEIAIGDIVKAPIPMQKGNINKMKFNGIINKKEEQSDDVQVITNNKFTSHYVGIVRYLGTTTFAQDKLENQIVTYLGLELMDPIGDCDGSLLDPDTGDWVHHFQTQPDYAVFVSVGEVVKIPPSTLLSTLTDAIQKLNKHIVSLSQDNYTRLQQIDKQQQHIAALNDKNRHLTKLAVTQLEKINDIKANNVGVTNSETAQNLPSSPDASFTPQSNSYPANSIPSSHTPTPRRRKDNGQRPSEEDMNPALDAPPPGHQIQASFASGYGITGGSIQQIQQYQHGHNLSMLSGVSNFAVHPQRGIPHISSMVDQTIPKDELNSPKLGHQPTPEIHMHRAVKSNMSELDLQTQLIQSYTVSNNNLQVANLPNTHNAIIVSNASYAPMLARVGSHGLHLSPQNSKQSNPITPPQSVLHQVTLSPGVPPGYITQQNMLAQPQFIVMDQNNSHKQYIPVNPTSLKQIGIASIPASPPNLREITPTPSPQPPIQNSILPTHPHPMNDAPRTYKAPETAHVQQQHNSAQKIHKNDPIADIVLSSSPNQSAIDHEVIQHKEPKRNGATTIRVIGKSQLKGVIKRKSQEAALREHLMAVNRERFEENAQRQDAQSASMNMRESLNDLDRIDLQASNSEEDATNSENEHGQIFPIERADSSEMPEIVLGTGHRPKRRRRSSVLSSHENPPPNQMQTTLDIDGYNAEDESIRTPLDPRIPIGNNNDYDHSPFVNHHDYSLSIRSLREHSTATAVPDHTYRETFEMAANRIQKSVQNILDIDDKNGEHLQSPETTPPYRICVTPPPNLNEDRITYNMQIAPNYVTAIRLKREASNPILSGNDHDSEHETNSVKVESGDHSPIPDSMQGTPKPTTPCTPYTPYSEGEEEAKQSQPMPGNPFQTDDMNHFDEEKDDDDDSKRTMRTPTDTAHFDANAIKANEQGRANSSSPPTKPKRKIGRKKTLTKRATQNYDDPHRAPWDKKAGDDSPVSVNHGTGYDMHLVAKNTDKKERDSESDRSMSLSLSESDSTTDHECDEDSSSDDTEEETETQTQSEQQELDVDIEEKNALGLLVSLNSLGLSEPIIESQGEEEEEEQDGITPLEHDNDEVVNTAIEQEAKNAEDDDDHDELEVNPLDGDRGKVDTASDNDDTPELVDYNTGEITQQSYGIGAPPSRHNRGDTLHLRHKKRGTLGDIPSPIPPPSDEDDNEDKDNNNNKNTNKPFELLDRDNQGSNDSEHGNDDNNNPVIDCVHLLLTEDDDALSDMVTPQPDKVQAPPTRFTFTEEFDENDNIGRLDVDRLKEQFDSGKLTSTTPISKQKYGVAAPPTKHNRDHSTVHDRRGLNVRELNAALLRPQNADEMVHEMDEKKANNDEEQDDEENDIDDNGSRGSLEYISSDESTIEELMDINDLHKLEACDSSHPMPHPMHMQMSTATREYVTDLGLMVGDNMDEMDLSDENENEKDGNDRLLELGLMAASASSSASLSLPDPSAANSGGSPTDSSVTPSPKQNALPIPNPGLIVNHSVESIGSVASDKGPTQHNKHKVSHATARSMGSLNIVDFDQLDFEIHQRHNEMDQLNPDKSDDDDDSVDSEDAASTSQGSMLIHDAVEHRESVINSSMDLGEDILDHLEDMEAHDPNGNGNGNVEAEDGTMTDEDGTDIHKKKGYTRKMKKFVPIINTKNVDSFEIQKQILKSRDKGNGNDGKSPKKRQRKSKKGHRLHQKSPKKVYSPHIEHMYHQSSPYDQHIFRPELDMTQHSQRNYSVKSKRSNRSSSSSSQRRGSKRSSKSSSKRNSKEYERRKSKSKQKRERKKRKSKRRHKKQRSRDSSSSHSTEDSGAVYVHEHADDIDHNENTYGGDNQAETNNANPLFYSQQFYPQIINGGITQPRHFQSHSLSHLTQIVPNQAHPSQQFIQQQNMQHPATYGINYNEINHPSIHGTSVSQGAMEFAMPQPNIFQAHQAHQQQQQIYHQQWQQ